MPRLEGRDIVCFANDWSGDPLSKKHVMTRLAKRNRVLWVNSLGNRAPRASSRDLRRIFDKLQRFAGGLVRVAENIHVLSPLAVPNYASSFMRRVNAMVVGTTVRAAMKRLDFKHPLLYTFVPASAWVADQLGCEHVIYHCVDEYSQFDGAGDDIALLEAELINKSDLVITCSSPLQESKKRLNANTVLIRHGVEHEHFTQACDDATGIPADIAALPKPVIGFYGLVAEWVDLEAMRRVAEAFPQGSLVIVGDINNANTEGLARLHAMPNVHFLGRRKYESLPGYCKAFDVALLPFVKNELTENANPLKLREYLAAGLPVVTTDIPEAVAMQSIVPDGVFLASTTEQFVDGVKSALAAGAGPSRARSEAMSQESWDAKVEEIETTLMRL
jgi:glycosyltransferase involved in cell wall biosynthesis